jgi:hypothetical protein
VEHDPRFRGGMLFGIMLQNRRKKRRIMPPMLT